MGAPIIIATYAGLQIWEDNPEFQASANSITQKYNIVGAQGMNWDQVRAALLNYAPVANSPAGATYAWPRRAMTLEEVEATAGIWKGSITWSSLSYQYAIKI